MNEIQSYVQRFGSLRSNRGNFNNQWEEAASLVIPSHRYSFNSYGQNNSYSPGQKKTEDMFDATASFAVQRFSSVIESLVTPQNSQWHRLVPVDKMLQRNRAARMYFDDVNDLLFSYRNRPIAGFVTNSQLAYLGIGAYGNGIIYIDTPDNSPGLRYRNIHLGEAYFVENHAGIVDTVYRSFWPTARNIVQQFGDDAPDQIKEQAKNAQQSETRHEVLHVVEPRNDYNPNRKDSNGKRFRSLYMCVEQLHALREGGYDSFPYAVSRYTQASGEVYGRGPAQMVLPSIKVLNKEKETVLKIGHRTADPVYLAHDDGVLGTKQLRAGKMVGGGLDSQGRPLVRPLEVGNLQIGEAMMNLEKSVINDAFLISLFQILVDTPSMTATEVLEKAKEKGMLLAPTAGRMQSEFIGSLIERELDLLSQQGLLPPPPPILRGENIEYKIEYDNPMSRMARSEKAAGFMRTLQVASEFAVQTQDPSAIDWFDIDSAMPEILDINSVPVAWTRTLQDVQQIRSARQQQVQQQQLVNAAPSLAAVAKAAPKTQG